MAFQDSFAKSVWRTVVSLTLITAVLTGFALPVQTLSASSSQGDMQALAPQATVIAEYNFEDNTTQGWYGRGATVSVSSAQANSGTYSLLTTGRTAGWNSPAVNVQSLLVPGATYAITASVRLVAGEAPAWIIVAMERQPVGGSTTWDWIAPSTPAGVTDAAWVTLTGSYTFADPVDILNLYAESDSADAEYYIDDIVIVMTVAPPTPYIAEYDFEDNTTQGWYGRGATVSVSSAQANSGTYSLLTTGRTAGWNSPAVNVQSLLVPGATYAITASVRLVAGEAPARIIVAMERQPVGGSTTWDWIAPSTPAGVTDAAWVTLTGSYTFADPVDILNLYAESDSADAEYYIDDIVIAMTAEPPTQEVNIVHGFEDGTTQGWAARFNFGAVANSTEVAHGGTHSLKMTGRTANWHAPVLDIHDVVTVGVQYDVAVWARLAATETTTSLHVSVEFKPVGVPTSTYQTVINNTPVSSDAWTQFKGKYTLAQEVDFLTIYVETSSAPTATFYIDDFSFSNTSHPPIQTDIPSVYETYANHFIVGAALETDGIASARHEQLMLRHFNSVTAGNAMKPGSVQPVEGDFRWTNADAIANFARDNGLYVHGHTLVWHSQAAEWMFDDAEGNPLEATPENKALLLERMETHIRAVVARYNDVVNVWDVVNEVIDPAQDDCLRRSEWYRLAGSDYISVAFQIAHEMAPTATLILNDYGETSPAKRQCMYDVVQGMQALGVPIDGIGMQMHINIQNPSVAAIEETIEMFAELGEVHITELDMSIYNNDVDSYTTVPPEVLIKQGYRYKAIFEALRRQGAEGTGNLQSVTFWGLADDATWLTWFPIERINLPLLFDEELQAKWAYWGIIDSTQLPVFIQEQLVSQATPVLDGATETLWDMLPWIEIPASGTLSATFQTRWDEDYVYVIVDVHDATASTEDKVEVFVDENNAKTATYDADDHHYTFPSQTMMTNYVIVTNTHGYMLEARIPVSVALAPGTRLGFDIRVTDSSNPTEPISWNDPTHSQNTNPSQFGTLVLIDAIRLTTAIPGTPVIDGRDEAVWANATEIETDVWVTGSSGATAKVKTLWDANHLYVYAVVSDTLLSKASTNAWEEDSIEVFVDQNNAKTAGYEPDDGQYRVNFDNEQSFGGAASADTLTSTTWIIPADQTVLLDGTYVVEAAISLTHVTPAPGVFIGFDFQVNDDGAGNGVRSSVVVWNDPTGQSYQNTSRIGVLQFVGATTPPHIYLPLVLRVAP